MALASSVQRKIMWLTPHWVLELLCRFRPKFVIELLCHWLNEKNPEVKERFLARRLIAPVHVAKKVSQLSVLAILNLLRQDESLWQFYTPTPEGGKIFNLKILPYILLQLIFDLGGSENREKIRDLIVKCRTTVGGAKQGDILRNLNVETVIDVFEMIREKAGGDTEVRMCLMNSISPFDEKTYQIVAIWLAHWDRRMNRMGEPAQSAGWVEKLPGERAFKVEGLLKSLEFRKKYEPTGSIYDYHKDAFIE